MPDALRFFAELPQHARERRASLIAEMQRLEGEGRHCAQCAGVCCTFVANSMKTTPLETAELLRYLHDEGRWDPDLRARLAQTIAHYRLDQEPPSDGRRAFGRRTYTCPFFGDQSLGCSISRSAKPYGCLGFNPRAAGLTEGGDCASATELLEAREQAWQAEEARQEARIAAELGLDRAKLPMPVALLRMAEALGLS